VCARSKDVLDALFRPAEILFRRRGRSRARHLFLHASRPGHPMRVKTNLLKPINVICPVQIASQKYSASCSLNHPHIHCVPARRGAFRGRHKRWAGDAVDAAASARHVMQGGVKPVSGQRRADQRCCRVRSSRVVLTPRRRRQLRGGDVGPTGFDQPPVDGETMVGFPLDAAA
jgi:hypothetical protein